MKHPFRLALPLFLVLIAACGQRTPLPGPTPQQSPFTLFLPAISQPDPGLLADPRAAYPPPEPAAPARLAARHHSGQTFLTWPERSDLTDEVYRVYRSNTPIDEDTLSQARLLAQTGKDSARVWANYFVDQGIWSPRLTERLIIQDGAPPLPAGTGGLVWTLAGEDFGGQTSGAGYYAVTVTPNDGEETLTDTLVSGPVQEAVGDPAPVEITNSPGIQKQVGPGGHYYLQYMDLRSYNPTFHAPNATNEFYGFDPTRSEVANALAFVYDYSVFEPTPELCGGKVPDPLPVLIFLHGARGNRYSTPTNYLYPDCAYGVYPIDQTETWYFGFARGHDYRTGAPVKAGDVIVNYTEQRVLRMLADLMRNPPGPAVDPQRIYLAGHSMGGTGSLAFAERYPNVFAAIYSGQPVTTFRATTGYEEPWPANLATKWGAQNLNLPIAIDAPNGWAAHLQKYNGTGVFDWQDLRAPFDPRAKLNRSGDDMVPFGIDHGTQDGAVLFPTQGRPLFDLLPASPRAWAGAITADDHQWSAFGWPPAGLANREGRPNTAQATPDPRVSRKPFWAFRVIRDETIPGLSNLSGNTADAFNQTILWSSSWNAWDGAPIDTPRQWRMSLCAVAPIAARPGEPACGSGTPQSVDITPRRLQQFRVTPGAQYDWENRLLGSGLLPGRVVARGTITASPSGVLTIPSVQISPKGNRITLRPRP